MGLLSLLSFLVKECLVLCMLSRLKLALSVCLPSRGFSAQSVRPRADFCALLPVAGLPWLGLARVSEGVTISFSRRQPLTT